jgi:hypothetical protein
MSSKDNQFIFTVIIFAAILCFPGTSMAADPVALENLRESFTTAKLSAADESQRKEIIINYIQQLTNLATDLRIYRHDIDGANTVRKEIRKVQKELTTDPADLAPLPEVVATEPVAVAPQPVPAAPVVAKPEPVVIAPKPVPAPVAAKPEPVVIAPKPVPAPVVAKPEPVVIAPKPVPAPVAAKPEPKKEHTPQTHVSSVQGLAGNDKVTKNNVYTFELAEIGASTTLAFWGTGQNSIDTYGKVWLLTPDGNRLIVGIWKESYFKKPATDVFSYYNLQPITENISKKVTGPGTYKIEFEWTNGKDPLVIYRVEITS